MEVDGDKHKTAVAVVHEEVPQTSPLTKTLGVRSITPKLRPVTVKLVMPDGARLTMRPYETTGAL